MTYEKTLEVIPERVERGAKLLSQSNPDWFREVDLDSLRLLSCSACVLGQLYGRFDLGLNILGFAGTNNGCDYGFSFNFSNKTTDEQEEELFQALTDEWKKKIRSLRE